MAVIHPLVRSHANVTRLSRMFVYTQEKTRGGSKRLGQGFRFRQLSLQFRGPDRGTRQMDKADEFVAVKEHPAPSRLASKHITEVLLEIVPVIAERDELVAL